MIIGNTDPAQRVFLFLSNYLYEYCSNTLQFYDGNDATPQAGVCFVVSKKLEKTDPAKRGFFVGKKKNMLSPDVERRNNYPPQNTRYSRVGRGSVYEDPDKGILELLGDIPPRGRVLEIGAGDGRYTIPMRRSGLSVVATDRDKKPLRALRRRANVERVRDATELLKVVFSSGASRSLKGKIQTRTLNAFGEYPFPSGSLDAVVCTALLYFFSQSDIARFVDEAGRVLKPGEGRLIFDFLTDRAVERYNGTEEAAQSPVSYTYTEGLKTIHEILEPGFVSPNINTTTVDADRPRLGHRLRAQKINVSAIRRA